MATNRKAGLGLEAVIVGLIIGAILLGSSMSSAIRVGAFNDDGVYVVLGKALAEGKGYLSIHLAGNPVQAKFPPGFPAILAMFWLATGSVEGVQQLVSLIHPAVTGLAAGLLWWVGRARLGVNRLLLGLFVLAPFVFDASIQYYTIPLSEAWFVLCWAACLALWSSLRQSSRPPAALLAATGLSAGLAILMRSHGVVLIPSLLLGLALAPLSRTQRALAAGGILIPVAAWYSYRALLMATGQNSTLPDEVAYGAWFGGSDNLLSLLGGSIATNASFYATQLGSYLTGAAYAGPVLGAAILGGMVFASLATLRSQPVLALSSLGGIAVVALWPFAQDRLLLAVLPFGGLVLALWLDTGMRRWPGRHRKVVAYLTVAAIPLILLRQVDIRGENLAAVSRMGRPDTLSPTYMLMVNSRFIERASEWIRSNTAASDRVMIDNHSGIYLYTGRQTTPATPAESRLQRSQFEQPGRYLASRILVDSVDWLIVGVPSPGIVTDVNTVIARCPGVLTRGGSGPGDTRLIYRVRPENRCLAGLITLPRPSS
jgi:hypothetical protein